MKVDASTIKKGQVFSVDGEPDYKAVSDAEVKVSAGGTRYVNITANRRHSGMPSGWECADFCTLFRPSSDVELVA